MLNHPLAHALSAVFWNYSQLGKTAVLPRRCKDRRSLYNRAATISDDIIIGISMGPTHERWTKDISYLTQHLESQNANVIVREANGSQVEQARQAKEMIEKEKLDVLIIVPVNSDAAGKLVDYAKSRDIDVIA